MTVLSISFDFDYFPLLIVIAIAWFVPLLMSSAGLQRIPSVIIEIIAGYIAGHFFLEAASSETVRILDFLAFTGFVFLMFLSGLEIDVDKIMFAIPRRRISFVHFLSNPLLVGGAYFMLTLGLSCLGAVAVDAIVDLQDVWYFSLIMVTTSVGIIFPVLKSRSETTTQFGQMLIMAAAIADIVSIILFTFTAFIIKNGFRIEIMFIIGLFLAFYVFYLAGRRLNFLFFRRISFQLAHAASQISTRGTLLLILIFVVISQYLGKEVVLLGAFLSGLLLSFFLHKDRSLLMIKLDSMGFGFFIPVFFIMVGVKFDASAFAEFDRSLMPFLLVLLLVMFAVKVLPSILWARLFGVRKAIAGGFLMSSRLSLIIAAAAIGLELGVISPGINASFILLAVVTCLFSPLLYSSIKPDQPYAGEKTIIVGGSSTGVLLARRLKMQGRNAVIIEKEPARFQEMKGKGLPVLKGDGMDAGIYRKLRLKPSDYVVVETGSDRLNVEICRLLRQECQHDRIISKSGDSSAERMLRNLDVEVMDARRVLASTVESLIIRPKTYRALVDSFDNYSVEDIVVSKKEVDGLQIRDIPFHENCTIILVERDHDKYIPHGTTHIRVGDHFTVFGTDAAIDDTRKKLMG